MAQNSFDIMDPRRAARVSLDGNHAIVSQLSQQDEIPWYNKPNLRFLYFLMAPTCLGVEMTSGFDVSMINGLQAVSSWLEYFGHPRSALLGLMVSMYSLGSFIAVSFVPIIVDKAGRRYPILLGGAISIVASVLQGSALNLAMFMIPRFMLGFANVLCIVAASTLIGELSHPKERALMGNLFCISFNLGAAIASVVTFQTFTMSGNRGWRIPSFLQIVPSLLQVSCIWFLPESPRWLISKGRGNEAYAILAKYHAEGDEHSEFVKAEYTQIKETLETELKIAQVNQNEIFSTPGMRKRVIIISFLGLFVQLCGIELTSNFLSLTLDTIGIHDNRMKQLVNIARFSWSFIFATFTAFAVTRYPRRSVFLVCAISLFITFTAWTVASAKYSFTHDKVSAQAVLVLIFFFGSAYNIGFSTLPYTYVVELLPFHVRARGLSLYQWWSRGAAVISQLVNPIGIDLAGWKWYIFYCAWNAFQIGFIYFMFPETSGRTLEELTFLFEDEREAVRQSGYEILCDHQEPEMYGESSRTAGRCEQG